MNFRPKRIKLAAGTIGALAAATLAVSTSPAAASGTYSGLDYVYGAAGWSDDWDNEGVVDINTNASSNATCLWQKVLWADGYLSSSADIDGIFGSRTKTATANWQSDSGVGVDGSAGRDTWSLAAIATISYVSGGDATAADMTLKYSGWNARTHTWTGRNFTMKRDASGNYHFIDGDGAWRKAGYNYRSCS
ncbi:peptidoglycan-binding domain-containing protein [Streptomyces sp. H51]|uniref:peptidoglycan-binding domain-containing protein n=1 Tax=Streptomyces sp. H51 TaxID=3111770 RepID=UPI002D7664EF|nr:peptidoglycan-binding domain-containing protein [Streptomyces sp. H51]